MIIRLFLLGLLGAIGWSDLVLACSHPAAQIFYCQTVTGRQVEVCDQGSHLEYRFGRALERPELALRVPRGMTSTWQWPGIGRYMSYRVTIPNGQTHYTVFFAVDRLSTSQTVEAGIDVSRNEEILATIACVPETLQQRLEGIDLPPTIE
jgi:hypothetical protein